MKRLAWRYRFTGRLTVPHGQHEQCGWAPEHGARAQAPLVVVAALTGSRHRSSERINNDLEGKQVLSMQYPAENGDQSSSTVTSSPRRNGAGDGVVGATGRCRDDSLPAATPHQSLKRCRQMRAAVLHGPGDIRLTGALAAARTGAGRLIALSASTPVRIWHWTTARPISSRPAPRRTWLRSRP